MRRILLAIPLGILTTVAVAWLLAAFMPIPMYPRRLARDWMDAAGVAWSSAEVRPFGAHDIWWDEIASSYAGTPDEVLAVSRARHLGLVEERRGTPERMSATNSPPGWGTHAHARPGRAGAIGSDTAFGWPLPCLWYSVRSTTQPASGGISLVGEQLVGGHALRGTPSARMRPFHALPLLPIWPALLMNALLWSLLWLAALTLPRALRRRSRLRRGRCAACGYDLAGIGDPTCPECGSSRNHAISCA